MTDREEKSAIAPSPGKLRPNQMITTFGPGSLMQTENDSVLIMGIDFWAHKKEYLKQNHVYLEKITKKDHFKMPYAQESSSRTIACTSFPRWGYCKRCSLLQVHKDFPESKDGFFCKIHPTATVLPARVVVTCPKGHLDDFPWVEWAHNNKQNPRDVCDNPKILWKGGRKSSSISNYMLVCENCNAKNSMIGAMDTDGIVLYNTEHPNGKLLPCSGDKPWLQQTETCKKNSKENTENEQSTETPIGIIARATSLHYAKTIRGIIIPSLAHPIAHYLDSDAYKIHDEGWKIQKLSDKQIADLILALNPEFNERGYTQELVLDFMERKYSQESNADINSESDLKKIEYEDLVKNENFDDDQNEKQIEIRSIDLTSDDKKYFKHARRLDILTSLEVMRYFTRLRPPGEVNLTDKNFNNETICSLEVSGKTEYGESFSKNNWLPCTIKKGEGIFLVFNDNFIKNCMNDKMKKRLDSLLVNHKEWEDVQHWPSHIEINPQYILLHSISHILIKEFAIRSGYNEASISERIYSSESMCGLLIYTTSAGDGSLGGLVRQIEKDLLKIVKKALEKAQTCSRDPICLLEDPATMKDKKLSIQLRQNGSACYGCMMLPETSCENFNKMLDRRILVDDDYGLRKRFLHD